MPLRSSACGAMTRTIGSGLYPVPAQRGHAPPPRRRLRAVEEYPAAFFGRAHLQPIQSSLDGTVVKLGDDNRQSGQGIAAAGAERHAVIAPRVRHQRKKLHRLVERPNGLVVLTPLRRIAFKIRANTGSEL